MDIPLIIVTVIGEIAESTDLTLGVDAHGANATRTVQNTAR